MWLLFAQRKAWAELSLESQKRQCRANGLVSEFVELATDQQLDDAFRHRASQENSTRELPFGVCSRAKVGWINALASETVVVAPEHTVRDQNCRNSKLTDEMGDVQLSRPPPKDIQQKCSNPDQ